MPNLSAIILIALQSMVQPSVAWEAVGDERIATIADDLILAASLHDGAPLTGDDRVLKLALAGAAIAVHESNLAMKVVSCRYDGDPLRGWKEGSGRSITQYQLMKGQAWDGLTKAEICSSGPLAAYLALKVLGNHKRCGTPLAMFNGYASGDCGRRTKAGARQCNMWVKAAKSAGLTVSCWAKL